MNTNDQTGIQSNERAFQNQFFVIRRGETLGAAMTRHRATHGPGPLVLMGDFNAMPAARRARQAVA